MRLPCATAEVLRLCVRAPGRPLLCVAPWSAQDHLLMLMLPCYSACSLSRAPWLRIGTSPDIGLCSAHCRDCMKCLSIPATWTCVLVHVYTTVCSSPEHRRQWTSGGRYAPFAAHFRSRKLHTHELHDGCSYRLFEKDVTVRYVWSRSAESSKAIIGTLEPVMCALCPSRHTFAH